MSALDLNSLCNYIEAHQEAVKKAYYHIISQVIQVLKTLENAQMRTHVELEDSDEFAHQFLSSILFLRLSADLQTISFAIDLELQSYLGVKAYTQLVRTVYRATMTEGTELNIEDCLEEFQYWHTDYEEAEQHPNARIITEDPN